MSIGTVHALFWLSFHQYFTDRESKQLSVIHTWGFVNDPLTGLNTGTRINQALLKISSIGAPSQNLEGEAKFIVRVSVKIEFVVFWSHFTSINRFNSANQRTDIFGFFQRI